MEVAPAAEFHYLLHNLILDTFIPSIQLFYTHQNQKEAFMAESVYKVIELVGTSKDSWEKAAAAAVNRAGKSLRDLRIAEIVQLDMVLTSKGKIDAYRAKIKVSFKYEGSS